MPEGAIDLRSGETIWRRKHGPPRPYPPLQNDASCEVIIIGGGITGALIAHQLINAGVNCMVIDQKSIGGGSSSASTALVLYELDTSLSELARQIGEPDAAACYRACLDSIKHIEQLAASIGDSCAFRRRSSYYLAESRHDFPLLEAESLLRQKHGMDVELLPQCAVEERFSFSRPGALLSADAAEIDVVAFVEGLINSAAARGLQVHAETQMETFRSTANGVLLRTHDGCEITAQKAVFATGYESERYLRTRVGWLKSTYAIATKPVSEFRGWPQRSLLWTTDRPYLYLRTTSDDRIIIGGGDVDFHDDEARDALLPAKAAGLESALRSLFPEIDFEVDCAWTGTFGETKDSLAYIGESYEMPGAYFALGYGGNGISYSAIAADIIRDLYLGEPNETARLFHFNRRNR